MEEENKSSAVKGAISLLIILMLLAGAWYYLSPWLLGRKQVATSDAQSMAESLKFGGDNYLGYWFIQSPEMKKQAASQGLRVDFIDDGGAYSDRLAKFAKNEYDAIVLPINSYLQHGAQYKFPGVIVAALCESRGADGIMVFADEFPSANVNLLNNSELKFVYTGESPSSFLLDLTISDFDLDQLKSNQNWRVEVGSSKEVFEYAKQKKGNAFVLWEPDLSKALELPGAKYIWGSDKFSGYIIDVFVFNRDVVSKKPETMLKFFKTYFRVLDIYANNHQKMVEEMSESSGIKEKIIEPMLKKINWFDLEENASLQFGISKRVGENAVDGVVNTIISCTNVLMRTGKFKKDPLEGNSYLIVNSSVIKELFKNKIPTVGGNNQNSQQSFVMLNDEEWKKLPEVGTMRIEPITFQSWNNLLDDDGKTRIDELAEMLKNNYANYRVVIRGHTGPGDDENENIQLSLERAQAVVQRLIAVHQIDANRLRAEGMGSSSPPILKKDESQRQYRYRLSRVEFVLYENNSL